MGWHVAIGCSVLAGPVVAFGTLSNFNVMWPVLAGLVLGVTSSLTARSFPVLLAVVSGTIAVMTSVIAAVLMRYWSGHWPLDEDTIAHYGTEDAAATIYMIALLVWLFVPCVVSALTVALAKRLKTRR